LTIIILTWYGKNLPAELRNLPPGTYALEPAAEALEV
jgi:hypothetical protein